MKKIMCVFLAVLAGISMTVCALAEENIPDKRMKSRLVDDAGIMNAEEENVLIEKLDEISERQNFDIVIVTTASLEEKTPEEYADDWYDYNGYGLGQNRDGVLFLVSTVERDWWISMYGCGIEFITDAGREYIAEKFLPHLKKNEYYEAFTVFAELCDEFISQAKKGQPYDVNNLPKGSVSSKWILIDIAVGLLLGIMITKGQTSKLKTVRKQNAAQNYIVPGSQMITIQMDNFVNRSISQRMIVKQSQNSGGSNTHKSSSGETHGGGGGKF